MSDRREPFGSTPDGQEVERYVLRHGDVEVAVLTYGAVLQSVRTPDLRGAVTDVALGYDDLAGYLADETYVGAVVGRFGNRIADGRFVLDGVEHVLPQNHGTSCLHGGPEGFHTKVWSAREVPGGVELTLTSPDGDMGFPGELTATVTYVLDADGLSLSYRAETDRPTVVNLTNHAYWNLAGAGTVEDHLLELSASRFVAVDERLIPTGIAPVEGTPMDFRGGRRVGERLREGTEQLQHAQGYDHAWLPDGEGMRPIARLTDPSSGRVLEVLTDQPSVQFYSGNFLDGSVLGRGGRSYRQGDGLCLETQHLPDSPNHPEFPSTVLRPGELYASTTTFRFGTTGARR
ncbi:aldose epimerase family protein [Blastococcus sp. PRF04-17]|uniref:aldose epimerase family protein n=1 Tax=Blastococcus sp. PRF04-17 TaxID=2933797 RepID=UPI001FF2FCB6|nr:aldose epimerase family protein [Blastococcus sp. PRF04-17]UOY03158.1 galactose mutarotase [Blastococcus sp. PRF04-17]